MSPDKPRDEGMPDFSGVTGGASTSAKDAAGKPVEVEEYETYEVAPGDSLSKIAKRKYGDAQLWKLIYEANRDRIKNPDLIQPGWKLKIPAKPGASGASEAKPAEARPAETRPGEPKPGESQPGASRLSGPKPGDPKLGPIK